jgi:hypothetical protein
MKIFIFNRIEQVSRNWHPEGGLVIISQDIDSAKTLIASNEDIQISDEEWLKVESFDLAGNPEPKFWVMEDAGCC